MQGNRQTDRQTTFDYDGYRILYLSSHLTSSILVCRLRTRNASNLFDFQSLRTSDSLIKREEREKITIATNKLNTTYGNMSSTTAGATTASSSLLAKDILTANTIEYDFEQYALEHGIPETLDPLPYRKAGSVFATGEEAEPVLTSAKHDPRLRTVVCRHWLRDLCMKGAACEFLHQYDLSKMPLCRHGERCKIKDCPFRHISEANRMECVFYTQGFCIHGPFCRYKHIRRDREDLPAVADFTLGLSQMQAAAKGGEGGAGAVQLRRPAPKPNEFFKISLCKHFMQGDCPFGDGCHFAHGEAELRTFPRKGEEQNEGGDGNEMTDTAVANNTQQQEQTATVDYFQGGAAGGGKPCPILEPDQAHFFIVAAAT